jgi:SAM-dependent methyltransferase
MLDKSVKSALDLGCGLGYESLVLARAGIDVLGIDHSSVAVDHAQQMTLRLGACATFQQGDAAQPLPLEDNQVGAVVSNMVLHSFPEQVLRKIIDEIERCVEPGGYLLFTANSTDDIPLRTVFQAPATLTSANFYELAGGQTIHFLSEALIRELLSGWTIHALEPRVSKDANGVAIKHFWKCIAQKTD